MNIIESTYTEGPTQQDGRRYVKERHTDSDGRTYPFEWLGVQDAQAVITARANLLNVELAKQDEALALVSGTQLPLTKLQFRELFTNAERQGIDAFHLAFESHPALTSEQKSALRTGLEDYKVAENIARPFDVRVQGMLGMYEALGLVTSERAAAIIAAGSP